ncbi:MAG: hydantoinase B/oxoprolinase family protein [Gaiella sp.]|nr:hydantoinase B/oxoprolinase family protein [Gaiella sp.]
MRATSPGPASAEGVALDPVRLEVIRNQLDGIAEEMEVALVRSAYSSIVKEGHDASTALFDASGEMIAQSTSLPAQLGLMGPAVRSILARFPVGEMADGDVFILNDPYEGGSHIPDVSIVAPVVHDGRVAGLTASIAHHMDMGGKSPGSLPTDSTEVFQEGIRFPPLRLYRAGVPDEAVHAVLERNVRIPETVLGDLRAQLAATHVGRTRFVALIDRYGADVLDAAVDELLRRGEAIARARIERIPDGAYTFEDYLDNDGIDLDTPVAIRATVIVSGSELTVDFTGSSPQVRGPMNADTSAVHSAVYFVVRAVVGGDAPRNGGVYRPVTLVLPPGTVVNPLPPAPVNARTQTMKRICDAMLGALVPAVPGRIPAAPSGLERVLIFGGTQPETGEQFVCSDLDTGGSGAGPESDGVDVIRTDIGNTTNVPAESLELSYPLRVHRSSFREGSAGAGRRRGGLGHVKEIEILHGPVSFTIRENRHYTRPWGLYGGLPGALSVAEIHRRAGGVESVPALGMYTLSTGDRIVCRCSGGAGYGDPLEREPELVLADLLDHKLTLAEAREEYGVVVADGAVDGDETEALRARLRDGRGPVAWIYDRGELGRT